MVAAKSRARWAEFLDLSVDSASETPLFQQIYLMLRGAIVSHTLAPGSQLPSTRQLAQRLGVSRTSVLSAYLQLLTEGYIEGRIGSGTFVSHDVPAPMTPAPSHSRTVRPAPAVETPSSSRRTSQASERCLALLLPDQGTDAVPFSTGRCSADAATIEAWRKVSARWLRTLDPVNLGYSDPAGQRELRVEVAQYLRASRAVRCDPDQIIITSGAQQAIDLAIRVLLNPGDPVWVEDPGYLPTRAALQTAGAKLCPVRVDENGVVVGDGVKTCAQARAAFVTPSHQYPTGAVLSMARRLDLLAWAAEQGAWIVEDDYDSEFRYVGRPLASLQGLDGDARVIYVGTLSKVLFPGVRIGFAVVPPDLVSAFTEMRFLTDRQPPTFQQAVVADFMRGGFLTGHIRRMRQRYRDASEALTAALRERLGDAVRLEPPECGMQLMMQLDPRLDDVALAREARRNGIITRPVSPMYLAEQPARGLLLGFTGFDAHQLRSASNRLSDLVLRMSPSRVAGARRS